MAATVLLLTSLLARASALWLCVPFNECSEDNKYLELGLSLAIDVKDGPLRGIQRLAQFLAATSYPLRPDPCGRYERCCQVPDDLASDVEDNVPCGPDLDQDSGDEPDIPAPSTAPPKIWPQPQTVSPPAQQPQFPWQTQNRPIGNPGTWWQQQIAPVFQNQWQQFGQTFPWIPQSTWQASQRVPSSTTEPAPAKPEVVWSPFSTQPPRLPTARPVEPSSENFCPLCPQNKQLSEEEEEEWSYVSVPSSPDGMTGCGIRRYPALLSKFAENESSDLIRQETIYAEFPWMVAIFHQTGKNWSFVCAGTLIENDVVLTGAHCLRDGDGPYSANSLQIVAGDWDLSSIKEPIPSQVMTAAATVIHENFSRASLINDIGLILLHRPFVLGDTVDTLCIAPPGALEPLKCRAIGWGDPNIPQENGRKLGHIQLPLIDRDTCQKQLRKTRLGKYFRLHESFICAGGEKSKDTCKGDGGGPLMCSGMGGNADRFAQVGIVSWGIDCGSGIPGVYSSIDYHYAWIKRHINLFKTGS